MDRNRGSEKQFLTEGSFTIEASVICCLVIICLIGCIYGCLYLHDKAVLEGAAYLAAQRGRLLVTENQGLYNGEADWDQYKEKDILWRIIGVDQSKTVAEYAGKLAEGKLFVCMTPVFQAETKGDTVRISYRADPIAKGLYVTGDLVRIPQVSGAVSDHGLEAEELLRLVKALTEEAHRRNSD